MKFKMKIVLPNNHRLRKWLRRLQLLALALTLAVQPGCGTMPPATGAPAVSNLGKVAVVAAGGEPEVDFEGFSRGKGEGAVAGAGKAFTSCAGSLRGGCSGDFCGVAIIVWLGVCGVASAVGGVVGAVTAPGSAEAKSAQAVMSATVDLGPVQDSLRDSVVAAGLAKNIFIVPDSSDAARLAARTRDYRPLAGVGVDTVLEVGLSKVGTTGDGIDPPLLLTMQAHARLVRTMDNQELASGDYVHAGNRLHLSEWSSNRAERLAAALRSGYEALGAQIYESFFLLYSFPDRSPNFSGFLSASFGLAPIYPQTRGQLSGDNLLGNTFEWVSVDGLNPLMEWQAFPRPGDIRVAPEEMQRIKNIRYDLVIARENNHVPGEVVYRREGLTSSKHRVEVSLDSGTRYFWTVRARFELDGRERVSEWSTTSFQSIGRLTAPSMASYRFRTP
jgi:hypothetical protein